MIAHDARLSASGMHLIRPGMDRSYSKRLESLVSKPLNCRSQTGKPFPFFSDRPGSQRCGQHHSGFNFSIVAAFQHWLTFLSVGSQPEMGLSMNNEERSVLMMSFFDSYWETPKYPQLLQSLS